jgi:hypothetical protein
MAGKETMLRQIILHATTDPIKTSVFGDLAVYLPCMIRRHLLALFAMAVSNQIYRVNPQEQRWERS